MQLTPLGYALIGLVLAKPQSGYALRNVFETTPMGSFSSSPGSIYPALDKLLKAGMLDKRAPETGGKNLFHVTPLGEQTMASWLRAPVTQEEIAKSVDNVLLRFAFLQSVDEVGVTLDFLSSFETAMRGQIESLETYLDSPESSNLSRHGRLAVENGLRGFRAHLNWVATAMEAFTS